MDDDGHVRIAGLGAASILSTTPVENTDQSFYGAFQKLVDPRRRWPTDTGATMASDVYAFADLALEVRMKFAASFDSPPSETEFMLRFSLCDPMKPLLLGFIRDVDRLGPTTLNSPTVCGR